jgi:hypothetical protein
MDSIAAGLLLSNDILPDEPDKQQIRSGSDIKIN